MTAILASLAIVTAVFAIKAFRKQAQEAGLLAQQLKDQQEANARQALLVQLQATELQESLAERRREREQRLARPGFPPRFDLDVLGVPECHSHGHDDRWIAIIGCESTGDGAPSWATTAPVDVPRFSYFAAMV